MQNTCMVYLKGGHTCNHLPRSLVIVESIHRKYTCVFHLLCYTVNWFSGSALEYCVRVHMEVPTNLAHRLVVCLEGAPLLERCKQDTLSPFGADHAGS